MITIVNTEADYSALSPDTVESSVVLVRASNYAHIDGVNAITNHPERGDIVVLDEDHNIRYIRLATFVIERLSGTWTTVGVVAYVEGQNVLVIHKINETKAWSDGCSWKLTGYNLDGTNRTGILSIRQSSDSYATNTDYTISYNASDTTALVAQLNTYFKANEPFVVQDWVASLDSVGDVILSHIFFDGKQIYNVGKNGFAMASNLMDWYASDVRMLRTNGARSGEGAIINMRRALASFRADNSIVSYNPSTDVTNIKRVYPVCLPSYLGTSQYQGDHCAYLRYVYGAGEEGWQRFMASCLPVWPNSYGIMGDYYASGLAITRKIALELRLKQDGTTVPFSPLATYCQAVNYDRDGIRLGEWAVPTIAEVGRIMDGVEYGTTSNRDADVLNQGLNKIGGLPISNGSYIWSCGRYSSYYGWFGPGSLGYYGGWYMNNLFMALPVAHLTLND